MDFNLYRMRGLTGALALLLAASCGSPPQKETALTVQKKAGPVQQEKQLEVKTPESIEKIVLSAEAPSGPFIYYRF